MRRTTTPDDRRNMVRLDAISAGDRALAELYPVELRETWDHWVDDVKCALCRARLPHARHTHQFMQRVGRRKLTRIKGGAVVRAEKAWRKLTGERIALEDLLRRELADRNPPTELKALAPMLGILRETVRGYAIALGLPIPIPLQRPRPPKY